MTRRFRLIEALLNRAYLPRQTPAARPPLAHIDITAARAALDTAAKTADDPEPAAEQPAPVDWQAIVRRREQELKRVGEARHQAEAAAEDLRTRLRDAEATITHTKRLLARRTETLHTRAERAEAAIARVRQLAEQWQTAMRPGERQPAACAIRAALDGTGQPTADAEQPTPVDWQATAQDRERDLEKANEALSRSRDEYKDAFWALTQQHDHAPDDSATEIARLHDTIRALEARLAHLQQQNDQLSREACAATGTLTKLTETPATRCPDGCALPTGPGSCMHTENHL